MKRILFLSHFYYVYFKILTFESHVHDHGREPEAKEIISVSRFIFKKFYKRPSVNTCLNYWSLVVELTFKLFLSAPAAGGSCGREGETSYHDRAEFHYWGE